MPPNTSFWSRDVLKSMNSDAIDVSVCSVRELLQGELRIPPYQRPYTWQASNVVQLIEDIAASEERDSQEGECRYRIGTIIVYQNNEGSFDIVDGQQRVVTFHLLLAVLDMCDGTMRLNIRNDMSTRQHLCENNRVVRQLLDSLGSEKQRKFAEWLLDGCEVLRVEVAQGHLSEAFQMFDSQNARGKELDPTDLLKAFHIRRMDVDGTVESRKRTLVQQWEQNQDEIQYLFGTYLYRIQCWYHGAQPRRDGLDAESIVMFEGIDLPGRGNEYECANWERNFIKAWYASVKEPRNEATSPYAFQIDQPIINGEAFFRYAEHYRSLLHQQTADNEPSSVKKACVDVEPFQDVPKYRYMTELFHAILLYYRDRFGGDDDDVAGAARMAFLYAAYMRLSVKSLPFAAVNNYVLAASRWEHRNTCIFEVIRNAARGQDVLSHMAHSPRDPVEESDDWGLWYRYILRSSENRIGDGKASSSEDILRVLVDNLQATGLFAKDRVEGQYPSISGSRVFDVLYNAGFIVHQKKRGQLYGLREEIVGDYAFGERKWRKKKEWVMCLDVLLKRVEGRDDK